MSSAAATAAASAAAMSAQAAEQAARRAECQGVFGSFDPHGATIQAMRAYATCVRDVHGLAEPWAPTELLIAKGCVVIALVCVFGGMIWCGREDGLEGVIMGALMGALVTLIVLGILLGLLFLVGAQ